MENIKYSPLQSWDRQNKILLLLGGLFLFAVLTLGIFVIKNKDMMEATPNPVVPTEPGTGEGAACTMDAKVCSDGSAVGRTGPNCEFALCPGENPALEEQTQNPGISEMN